MGGSFLRLELDNSGIKAFIFEQGYKETLLKDDYQLLFEDLPDPIDNITLFDAGMDEIAQSLDLESCSKAVIFVSPFFVCFRNIALPFSSEKKIKQVLSFELEPVMPYSNQTYISDFHSLNLESNSNLILTASVLESDIETYYSVLGKYGIKPVLITHKGYAVAASFLKNRRDVTDCLFFHVTDQASTLVLIKGKKPCMVRVFKPSQYKDNHEEFAKSVHQTIIGFQQRIQLESDLDIFISFEDDGQDIVSISDALTKSLKETFTQKKVNTNLLLSGIVPDKKLQYLFNFSKGQFASGFFIEKYLRDLTVIFFLGLFTFILSIININIDNSRLADKIAFTDNKALLVFKTTFPEKKKVYDPYLQMKADVMAVLKKSGFNNTSKQTKSKEINVVDVILELSNKMPSSLEIEVSRFSFNNGRLILSGSTDNFNNVDKIKSNLEESDVFTKVSISSAATDKSKNRVNFKFIIEM